MNEEREAVVVLCKCGEAHRTYGIRAEKLSSNHWNFTWAFPIKEASAKREGYDKTMIKGEIDCADEYPGCPYCRGKRFVVCSCGHIGCTILRGGVYTCEWCGAQGVIEDYSGQTIKAGNDL